MSYLLASDWFIYNQSQVGWATSHSSHMRRTVHGIIKCHSQWLAPPRSEWIPANLILGGGGDNPAMNQHPIQGGVEILLAAPCYDTGISPGLVGHFDRIPETTYPRTYGIMLHNKI